jgi:hypothetical protein
LSLMTTLASVRLGARSSLVIVQVTSWPRPTVTVSPSPWLPPTQTQSEAARLRVSWICVASRFAVCDPRFVGVIRAGPT